MDNTFLKFDLNGVAAFDHHVNITSSSNDELLTVDKIRNTNGATFDKDVIVSEKAAIGYAHGTDTSVFAEQLKITNPNGVNHVVARLDQGTNQLDSSLILHTKNGSGANRLWGIKADGSDENFYIGIANDNNQLLSTVKPYIKLDRTASKIEFNHDIEVNNSEPLTLKGGIITANINESSSTGMFVVNPAKAKVGVGRDAANLTAFTQTSGQFGDFDLVIGNKDGATSSSANLAFATEQSSVEKTFEIELDHTNSDINFRAYTDGLQYKFRSYTGAVGTQIDPLNGALTTNSLTLDGAATITNPTIQLPALGYQYFAGTDHGTTLYSANASGGYFSIYNNVKNVVSFIDGNDDTGIKEDSSRGWAGITMDTSSGSETKMDFYAGGIDGTTSIASKDVNTAMRIHSNADGASSLTVDQNIYVTSLADSATAGVNRISVPNQTSILNKLLGNQLTYTNASLTKVYAKDINTDNIAAGNIFASSGLGLVSIKGRLDVNEEDGDPASINLHRGQGNGIQLLNSDGSKFAIRSTNHATDSADYSYTGDPVLFELDHSTERITLGGNIYANSGIYQGDLNVNRNLTSGNITADSGNISTLQSTALTVQSLTPTTLDVSGQTVKVSPDTSFEVSISGVTRPGYLVTASGSHYYLGQGELGTASQNYPGVELLVAPDDPTTVTNFRIVDVNPHSDILLAKDRVTLKWGFDDVRGAEGPDTTIGGTVYKTFGPVTGSVIDLPDTQFENQVSGRYLRMPSGKKHKVIAWNNATKFFTLDLTYDDSEGTNAANPARLIDHGTGYTLNVLKALDNGANVPWQSFSLGNEFINNPRYVMDLELNDKYYFLISTHYDTKTTEGPLMASGVFDPDSNAGGQGLTEYGVPFVNKLPYLTTLPTLSDHLTLNATQFGFTVTVNGFGSTDFGQTLNTDPNQIAHQFEVGYTTADTFDWASSNTVRTTMPFVSANNFPIANIFDSDTYTVAVRPLQNTQVVYDESTSGVIKKSILAGGGGVPPNMQVLVDNPFSLTTYSGTYTGQFNDGSLDVITLSGVTFNPDPLTGKVTVGFNQMSANSGGQFSLFESSSLSEHTILSNGQFDGNNSGNEGGASKSTAEIQIQGTATTEFHATSTDFTIGTTESARKLFETQLEADYTMKKIVVDIDFATGCSGANPGIIRVYPKGNTAAGDSIQITAGQGLFSQAIDLQINTNIEANRTLIVDAFDTSASPNNNWSGTGRIWIYGQPYDSNLNQNQNTGGTVA